MNSRDIPRNPASRLFPVVIAACAAAADPVALSATHAPPGAATPSKARQSAPRPVVHLKVRPANPERLRYNLSNDASWVPASYPIIPAGRVRLPEMLPVSAPGAPTLLARADTGPLSPAGTPGLLRDLRLPSQDLSLQPGQSRLLEFRGVKRVAVGDPKVADVAPVSPAELLLTAKGTGETTLIVWDELGRHTYQVRASVPEKAPLDLAPMVQALSQALQDPAIRVHALGQTLFIEGTVTDPKAAQRAEMMAMALSPNVKSLVEVRVPRAPEPQPPPPKGEVAANLLDEVLRPRGVRVRAVGPGTVLILGTLPEADAEQVRKIVQSVGADVTIVDALRILPPTARQVLIRARVVDINRARLRNLGVDWGHAIPGRQGSPGIVTDQPFLFGIFGQPFSGGADVNPLDPIGARLNLLEQQNAARILSEPTLIVMEGSEGEILVGGEFPYPQVQNVVGGLGSVTVEFKEFGVQLGVQPLRVADDGVITLRVKPEVSLLDFANAVEISGFTLPALRTRRESSTVRIASGQTLAVGGLIENSVARNVRRIPLLSRIPILGELFKSTTFQRNESELVILISPEVVEPGTSPILNPLDPEARRIQIPRPDVPDEFRFRTEPPNDREGDRRERDRND